MIIASLLLAFGLALPYGTNGFAPTERHFARQPLLRQTANSASEWKDLDRQLKSCRSAREATRVLDQALMTQGEDSDCLYKSVSIPVGASTRGISDGDLAIQTRLANKKYRIMDLIELSGDRDADRASLAAFCLMVASSGSAIAANQSLPGPEIFRFIVVWILSFAPLAFAGIT